MFTCLCYIWFFIKLSQLMIFCTLQSMLYCYTTVSCKLIIYSLLSKCFCFGIMGFSFCASICSPVRPFDRYLVSLSRFRLNVLIKVTFLSPFTGLSMVKPLSVNPSVSRTITKKLNCKNLLIIYIS